MDYPFTPEILDALPEHLAELFRELEDELLRMICSHLDLSGQLNEVTVQAIRALRSHGVPLKDIREAIKTLSDVADDELDKLFADVVERNQKYSSALLNMAKVTEPEYLVSDADVEAIRRQTGEVFHNITASMGFLVDSGRTMLPPAEAYQWALDSALLKIQSGAVSYDSAIRDAVKQLGDSGLRYVDYESGRRDHIDVAARRAIMTGVSQLNEKFTEQSMEESCTDIVETSAHYGARDIDGPNGWEAHTKWQGRLFRWAAKKGNSTGEYPDYEESCGFGDVTGIYGANCRHHAFPFIEGVSERTYTDAQLADMADPKPFEYEGKQYTKYSATQKQREIERTIRTLKRRKTAFESAGLKEDANLTEARLKRLNEEYRNFSKAAGLPTQLARLEVLDQGDAYELKRFAPLKEYSSPVKITGKFSERQYVVDAGKPTLAGTTQHYLNNLAERPDRAGLTVDKAQDIINNSRLTLYQTDRKVLKFIADDGYVVMNIKNEIITAVPENLRKKYRTYLEGK